MRIMRNVNLSLPAVRRRWQGHIDSVLDDCISGWAMDKAAPMSPVEVSAVASSGKRIVTLANAYRDDLERSGFGDGRHGFTLDLSSWSSEDGEIDIAIVGSEQSLNAQPITVVGRPGSGGSGDDTARWRGYVDLFDRNFIRGWAIDLENPHHRIEVEAVSSTGGRVAGFADGYREDLKANGHGDGCHAFELDIRGFGRGDCPIEVVVNHGKARINQQPLDFDVMTMLGSFEPPASIRALLLAAAQAVLSDRSLRSDLEAVEGGDGALPLGPRAASGPSRKLFEAAQPAADPEGLISRFVQFECFRIEQERRELQMRGSLQERLETLIWYISHDQGAGIQDKRSRPISRRQREMLNASLPIAGYPSEITVALFNIARRERPEFTSFEDPRAVHKALYWWCCEWTTQARLDDSLTTRAMAALLSREESWSDEAFSLNVFMTEYFNAHPELHALNVRKTLDRAVFVIFLIVKSFTEPYIARFLPREMLRLVLLKKDGSVRLDDAVTHLAGFAGIDGETVRRKGEALLAVVGLSLRHPPSFEPGDHGHGLIARRDLSGPLEAGVAMIGPLHKMSGLGQAMRLSVDAVKLCEAKAPTTLVFDLGNPAPVSVASALASDPFEKPREINLIHLNAEAIPLAFSYEQQEIFARSYNIGYVFWELNMIPKCHLLALELLDEVWVSSEYNREIYSRYTDKPVTNVGMAVEPMPNVEPMERATFGLARDATVFLSTFDSFSFIERKNPMGALDAFRLAFPRGDEPVQLVLKTQNRGRVSDPYQVDLWRRIDQVADADPRIIVINETFSYRDVLALKLACDCYVSLHRSEGWGFGMLEAMNLGRPVIATAYSGNMDFCTPETTYLVDYDLIGVREAEYILVERGSVWAQPRLAQAAERMRQVMADPDAARARGKAGAEHIRANFSIEAIARRYGARLGEIRATRGAA